MNFQIYNNCFPSIQPKPFKWMLDVTWLNICELKKIALFDNLLTEVENRDTMLVRQFFKIISIIGNYSNVIKECQAYTFLFL